MSEKYQCPKCGGQDVYMGNKTIMGGIGGIWGNRSKDVVKPFCRTCDIEALSISTIQKANKTLTQPKLEPREIVVAIGLFILGMTLMLLPVNQVVVFTGMGIVLLGAIYTILKVNSKK